MSESVVNAVRRYDFVGADLPTAAAALAQIPEWLAHYNAVAPHQALAYQVPRSSAGRC